MGDPGTLALEFRRLTIREKMHKVSERSFPGLAAREVGELHGITGARVFQVRALERLRGPDGESIKDAIDQKLLALDRVVKAIQAYAASDEAGIRKVQEHLLSERALERTIATGYDPTRSKADRRRTNSGRRKTAAGKIGLSKTLGSH